jgi:DICT domain-containing protein
MSASGVRAVTRAIGDEALARGERIIIFGSFPDEGSYRDAEDRWQTLAAIADVAVARTRFAHRWLEHGVLELPVDSGQPVAHERGVVCWSRSGGACLVTRAVAPETGADAEEFDVVWTADPLLVRQAVRVAAAQAAAQAPEVPDRVEAFMRSETHALIADVGSIMALTSRMLRYLDQETPRAAPAETPKVSRAAGARAARPRGRRAR